MSNLFPSKGCFYRVSRGGTPYYRIKPEISSEHPILLVAAPETKMDIIAPVECLDNIKILYTFGQKFGNVRIEGIMLLGPSGNLSDAEQKLDEYFNKHRSSVFGNPVKLSKASNKGGSAIPFFLVSMQKGMMDPERHILPFVLEGVVLDNQNK